MLRAGKLANLSMSGRHVNISICIITQQLLTLISKPIRNNITKLLSFYNPSKKDSMTVFDDFLGECSLKERKEILDKLRKHKHSRLEINLNRSTLSREYKVVTPDMNNKC